MLPIFSYVCGNIVVDFIIKPYSFGETANKEVYPEVLQNK